MAAGAAVECDRLAGGHEPGAPGMNQQIPGGNAAAATVESRLSDYLRSVWPSNLSQAARSNLRTLYRGIAGEADASALPSPHTEIPKAWLERDQSGRLIGVGGLSRAPTAHAITFVGRTLYAWCAFDCLFLPAVLDATLEVTSTCPQSGRKIALRVSAEAVEHVSPAGAVISFVTPQAAAVERGLRQVFCRHVRYFQDAEAAKAMLNEEVLILTPAMAHRLGGVRNQIVFGQVLGDPIHQSSN